MDSEISHSLIHVARGWHYDFHDDKTANRFFLHLLYFILFYFCNVVVGALDILSKDRLVENEEI